MPSPTVLFLCSGNYYRSRFAEYYFRYLAHQQGLNWESDSRGLALEPNNIGPLSAHSVAALTQRDIPFDSSRFPMDVTVADLERAALVIAVKEAEHRPLMRRRFPDWEQRVEYWAVHDLDVEGPHQAIPVLCRLVERLIERLKSEH